MSPVPAAPSQRRRSIARARKSMSTMKTTPDQLSLPLFDTTALTSSMGLYSGLSFGEPADDSIAETEEDAPAPVVVPALNFRLTSARRLSPDWKTRAADNIAAIRLMLEIEEEARNATAEEQERLALFTSFGASDLANNIFRRSAEDAFPKGWDTLGEDLEELVSPAELASLARVTQYAHFTPEFMVAGCGARSAAWASPRSRPRTRMRDRPLLRPHAGSPRDKTTLTGVEMDPVTARIAKLLHPSARIRAEDFTKARIARLTTSSSATRRSAAAPSARRSGRPAQPVAPRLLHREVDRAAAAGRTRGLRYKPLDHGQGRSDGPHVSRLHGRSRRAVRLPEGALRAAAGTDVVVDILFFQKRGPDEPAKQACWIDLAEVMAAQDGDEAISINRHFVERPTWSLDRTRGHRAPTVRPTPASPFPADRSP